jgi:hypothetical protein
MSQNMGKVQYLHVATAVASRSSGRLHCFTGPAYLLLLLPRIRGIEWPQAGHRYLKRGCPRSDPEQL